MDFVFILYYMGEENARVWTQMDFLVSRSFAVGFRKGAFRIKFERNAPLCRTLFIFFLCFCRQDRKAACEKGESGARFLFRTDNRFFAERKKFKFSPLRDSLPLSQIYEKTDESPAYKRRLRKKNIKLIRERGTLRKRKSGPFPSGKARFFLRNYLS